ncbi:MAG TPA: hypothetical protein VJC39_03280 [Candidatus Nanoarchaeia archaeon]|nr:hypothetical protein [Candidatus Nanoarchaeia archaeon]
MNETKNKEYFIGLAIAFLTQQVSLTNPVQLLAAALLTIVVSSIVLLLMLNFKTKPENIISQLENINL